MLGRTSENEILAWMFVDKCYCISVFFPAPELVFILLELIHDDPANCTGENDQYDCRKRHFSLDYLTIHLVNLVLVVRLASAPCVHLPVLWRQYFCTLQGVY